MFGPLLRETTIIIIFCNIFVECQDFLEYYKPNPGLPKELNEWLREVQKYKGDFRLIRAIAKKQDKYSSDYDSDELANIDTKLFDNLDEENEYLDEVPKNDIYPHMYKKNSNPYENFGTSFDVPSKHVSRNLRQRRHSQGDILSNEDIYVNPKSDDGEIKRSDDKYPDRFFKDNLNQKREIQIDVLNDGKLVKQIRENDKEPKSIVLNIQSLDNLKNPPQPYKPEPIAMENEANQNKPADEHSDTLIETQNSQIKPVESQVKLLPAQRSAESEIKVNSKEISDNFKNLFDANENLNTDSSIARQKLAQTALLYHVTLPDAENFLITDPEKITVEDNNQGGFSHNGLKDLSQYWTSTEKNQIQKGIDYARGNWNGMPLQQNLQAIDNDGFELVKSVVMDSNNMKDKYNQIPSVKNIRDNKRESQTIEGRVRINAEEDNVIYNAEPSKGQEENYVPLNSDEESEERKDDTARKNIKPNVDMETAIESFRPTDEQQERLNVPLPDAPVNDNLYGTMGKVEEMGDADVNDLLPEEYRETTPEFIIPPPEEPIQNVEDMGLKRLEPSENVQVPRLHHDHKHLNLENPVESCGIDGHQDHELLNECSNSAESKHHHHHADKLNHFSPLTRIHEVNQNIQNHLSVTRIETITEITRNQESEEEEGESSEEDEQEVEDKQGGRCNEPEASQCLNEQSRLQKAVEILPRPLTRFRKKEKEYLNHAPPEPRKIDRLQVKMRQCEGGNYAEEDEDMEQKIDRRNSKHKKKKQKHHKRRRYRDKMRYNVGRDENDEFLPNDPEGIPAFGRHLQGVEYIYDADMGAKEESSEGVSSTERNRKIGMLHKKSPVEGDYGDEEDSLTKDKKERSKLVKKTNNKFANLIATTTEADDDDEDYYDEAEEDNSNNDEGQDDEELASFGRRLHKQTKLVKKSDKQKKSVRENPKDVREVEETPKQKFLDKSEFQHWPQFVISDKINEENLRKRSLAVRKIEPQANIFPLSSKDYFTKSNPKRRDSLSLDGPVSTEKNNMEVKFNLNLNMDNKLQKPGDINGVTLFPVSNSTANSNSSVASTQEECDDVKVSVGNVCEENENFNKTKVVLTTVLSIIPDTQEENENNNPKDDFLTLEDILTGHLPFKILEYVKNHIKQDKNLRKRFHKGMKISRPEESFQNLMDATNEQSKKIINAMATLMNQLQITSTCQSLPGKLLGYLKAATRVRLEDTLARAKEMEEVEFDEVQNQDNFIFQSNSRADNLEQKVRVLKDLLGRYNHLPDTCKQRAEPVREYVQNHLKLLTGMLSGAMDSPQRPKKTVPDQTEKETVTFHNLPAKQSPTSERDLVEEQLESLGLGPHQHNFRPKFSLDELIQHNRIAKEMSVDKSKLHPSGDLKNKKNKRDLLLPDKEEISEQYEKLREAVRRERTKRDSERRVAENFGRLSVDDYNGEGVKGGNFEAPLVFSF